MMKTMKRAMAMLLIAVLLLGLFVMPSTPAKAAPAASYDINKVEGYQVVAGAAGNATDNASGFTVKKGTMLQRHPDSMPDKAFINYAVYSLTLTHNDGGAFNTSSYVDAEIVVSYKDAQNYRYFRLYQVGGYQYSYYGTVTNGVSDDPMRMWNDRTGENMLDLSQALTVTIDNRTSNTKLTLAQGEKSWELSIPILAGNIQTLVLGGATSYQTVTATYDNIQAETLTQSLAVRYNKEYQKFMSKYAELFNLSEQYLSKNYKEDIEAALYEYESLSSYVKLNLVPEKEKLETLYTQLDTAPLDQELQPADPNYREYSNDFEGAFGGFTNFSSAAVTSEIQAASGNHALVMKDGSSALAGLTLKNYMVPQDSAITQMGFDFRVDAYDTWQQIRFMLAYKDANNYTYIQYEIQTNNRFAMDIREVVDGTTLIRQQNTIDSQYALQMDFTKWGHIDLLYNGKSVNIIISVNGVTLPVKNYKCSFLPLKPVLLASSKNDTYFDNVSVQYEEYVETVTDESEKLAVYYTGNTEQYPNDAVMVTGNKIFENVSSIQIKEIAAASDFDTQSYIKTDWYNESGFEGTFIHSTDADYSEAAWENSTTVEILQPTDGTLKFVIPKEFTKGMYAVRFNGFDYGSSEDDVIYYLNRPRISFVAGDEGKITTAGGSLKIVGDMLVWGYDQENAGYPNVRVLIKGENATYIFDENDFIVENANGIQLPIPADMEQGTYEVSVYNGIGGTDGWSAPVQMTVGESPRASWPKEVFNVKDFGANGEQWQNATGAVVKALEAAALNGGGVVYFPEGQYNLCNSIVIPENVLVKGDGAGRSIIFWSMDMWPDGSLPGYVVGFTQNVEFRDLGFYACRVNNWFVSKAEDVQNVYFNDLYVYTNPYGQYPTDANSGADGSGEVGRNELFDMIREEIFDQSMVFNLIGGDMSEDGAQNIRFDNVTLKQSGTHGGLRGVSSESDYFYANNFNMTGGGWDTIWGGSHAVFQNSDHTFSSLSVLGIGMYFYNNNLHDVYHNNRELFVADYPEPSSVYGLKKLEGEGSAATGDEDCWYEIIGGRYGGKDTIRYYQLKVADGQGSMQSRYIVKNEGNKICINSPFAVTPDSNSVVEIREGRQDSYFIQNTLNEGGTGMGWYSGTVGVVYDSNVRTRSGVYMNTWGYDTIWYVSLVNESFDEPYMFGGYGYQTGNNDTITNDHGGYTSLHLSAGSSQPAGAFLGFTVRRCQFLNGSYIDFVFTMGADSARGILIEDNVFDRVSKPVIFYSTYGGLSNFDGAMVRNNVFTRVNEVVETSGTTNVFGSPRILVINDKTTAAGDALAKGDVNGDGKISLKDVTMLKYHLADMIVLDDAALDRADVNSSGYATLKDASAIRYYVTYKVWMLNYADVVDNNDGYFGGDW